MAVALHYGRSRNDPSTQYFVPWLICDPWFTPPDWEIDLSTLHNGLPSRSGQGTSSKSGQSGRIRAKDLWRLYEEQGGVRFEGVLVKNTYRKQVWRLTGNVDSHGHLEGTWPD
jgi:hypothetical protein